MITVYRLRCVVNGKMYVGITRKSAETRFKTHCYEAIVGLRKSALAGAIRKYGRENFECITLYVADSWAEAQRVERGAIAEHNTFAHTGYNLTIGGDGTLGHQVSVKQRMARSIQAKTRYANDADLRARISATMKTLKKTPEHNRKVSEALKGKTHSVETRRRLSEINTGKKQSPEVVAKRAAKMRGRKLAPHHAAMIGDRSRGVPKSPEHRAKLSAVLKGRKLSPERCAQIGNAHRGKSHSEEHRKNISAALTGKKMSPERLAAHRAMLLRHNGGKPKTGEWKAKVRATWAKKSKSNQLALALVGGE